MASRRDLEIEDEYARTRRSITDQMAEEANRQSRLQEQLDDLDRERRRLRDELQKVRRKQARFSKQLEEERKKRDRRLQRFSAVVPETEEEEESSESKEEQDSQRNRLRANAAEVCLSSKLGVTLERLYLCELDRPLPSMVSADTFETFLEMVRVDWVEPVYARMPDMLLTSVVEEERALTETTAQSRLGLRPYQALDAALRSPDCSCRVLSLLTSWVYGGTSFDDSRYYPLEEMIGAWVAGFEGLEWPKEIPLVFSSLLPINYAVERRIVDDQGVFRLVPPIQSSTGVPFSYLPRRFQCRSHVYVSPLVDPIVDDDDECVDLDRVTLLTLNDQRFFNQVTKLLTLLTHVGVFPFFERVLCRTGDSPHWAHRVMKKRSHYSLVEVAVSEKTRANVLRVVKNVLRL